TAAAVDARDTGEDVRARRARGDGDLPGRPVPAGHERAVGTVTTGTDGNARRGRDARDRRVARDEREARARPERPAARAPQHERPAPLTLDAVADRRAPVLRDAGDARQVAEDADARAALESPALAVERGCRSQDDVATRVLADRDAERLRETRDTREACRAGLAPRGGPRPAIAGPGVA